MQMKLFLFACPPSAHLLCGSLPNRVLRGPGFGDPPASTCSHLEIFLWVKKHTVTLRIFPKLSERVDIQMIIGPELVEWSISAVKCLSFSSLGKKNCSNVVGIHFPCLNSAD